MDAADKLYQDFLSELDTLERFRQGFQRTYPSAPLEREDPDMRRLMEAMAFFSVQTRQATLHNLRSTWVRLFSSYFDFLLEPLPAAALVQAVPSEKMVEVVRLPRGTELRLEPAHGVPGAFRLERDLTVLPVSLKQTDVLRRDDGGWRMILRFEGAHPRKDGIGLMSLHVRHLEEYRASLAVFHALRKHLEQVSVVYDEPADERSVGTRCKATFGRDASAPESDADFAHPLQRVRSFFQQPEQGLYLHVDVAPTKKAWTRFCLCIDLNKDWKVGNSPHPDFLQPFVAPVVNLKAEPAQPLAVDGTRSEYPLQSLSGGADLRLQSVTGVYELKKEGRVPMRPAFLPGEGPSYEIDEALDEALTPRPRLQVRMPDAFLEPRKVLVEALWYQPRFAPEATGRTAVSTPGRHVEGLKWQVVGDVQQHRDSPLLDDVAGLTRILSWKVKPTLSRDELIALLSYLGTPVEGAFRPLIPWIRTVKASVLPDGALRGTGLRHVYEILLEPFDSGMDAMVTCLLEQVQAVLDAWNGEATVEVRATSAGGPFTWKSTP